MAQIEIRTYTEVGGHIQNEDTVCVQEHSSGGIWVCAIADGQGGQRGGERASQLSCQTILDLSQGLSAVQLSNPRTWLSLVQQADLNVYNDPDAGLTTLVAFCIHEKFLVGASTGDSALVVLNAERVEHLTKNQLKNPPIGSGRAAVVPFGYAIQPQDVVLAMTDGVWKYIGWEKLIQVARTETSLALFETLRKMAALPRSGNLQDDFTIIRASLEG